MSANAHAHAHNTRNSRTLLGSLSHAQTIPASKRVDALATRRGAILPQPTPPAASAAVDHFAVFKRSHGIVRGLTMTIARACFEALNEISASVSVQWHGDALILEEALAGDGEDDEVWERLETEFQQAASATLDVSRMARLRHMGAACVDGAVVYGADSLSRVRQLFSKTTEAVVAPVNSSGKLTFAGDAVAWCWETGHYERASEVDTVTASARASRKKAEVQDAIVRDREAKKAGMSKRERKKAEEHERKEMDAVAVAAAAAAAVAQEEMHTAQQREERRLADPVVQKDLAYHKQTTGAVLLAVSALIDNFVAHAAAVDNEAKI